MTGIGWGLSQWLLALVVACGVPQEEFDALRKERDELRKRIATYEDEVDQAKGRIKELETRLEKALVKQPTRPPEAQVAATYSTLELGKDDKVFATLKTSKGDIECELLPQIAPNTVLNFVGLAEGTKEWTDPESGLKTTQPLYKVTKFHRVIDGFMIQGGDPLGTGRGGPGYTFPDEVWPDVRFDRPGLLAMANAGPNTNGSQFFVTDGKQPHLNGRHTIFGLCDPEVVRDIMKVPVGGADGSTPVQDVLLKDVAIRRVRSKK